jgi:pimeloyl-ACP methyl ester carboxylesterase
MAYRWSGNGPEIVVLVNGSVFNFHQWDRRPLPILYRGLKRRCRFLQYDYLGIGGSSAKAAPFSMLDLADELCALLDVLSVDRAHLLGISKGSLVGQAFLIRHQERAASFCGLGNPCLPCRGSGHAQPVFQQRVEALEEMRDIWHQRINREVYAGLFDRVYIPTLFFKRYEELSPAEHLKAIVARRMLYRALEGTFVQTMVDLFRYYAGDIAQEVPTFAEGLPRVQNVPILLLNGTADNTTPVRMSRELAQLLPGAELVEFDGVTHLGPMLFKKQARTVFGRYVDFAEQFM